MINYLPLFPYVLIWLTGRYLTIGLTQNEFKKGLFLTKQTSTNFKALFIVEELPKLLIDRG